MPPNPCLVDLENHTPVPPDIKKQKPPIFCCYSVSFLFGREGLAAQAAGHVADGVLQGLVLAVEGFAVFRDGFDLGGDGFETGLHVLGASGRRNIHG